MLQVLAHRLDALIVEPVEPAGAFGPIGHQPGERIKVVSKANPGRAFPVKVTEFTPGRRMTWSGGMPLGLFKGVRTFTLAPGGDGATRFTCARSTPGHCCP